MRVLETLTTRALFVLLALCAAVLNVAAKEPPTAPLQTGKIIEPDSMEEYFDPGHLRYENHVYNSNIRTVLLHRKGHELTMPVITLGSNEQLHLHFDDISPDISDFVFEFVHCGANWQPTDFMPMEFIDGLPYDYITDYDLSRNTLQTYTHYNLYFPYNGMQLTKSGNYIVKVYPEGEQDNVVLTWRFMIIEPKVRIKSRVHAATDVAKRFSHQEVDFSVLADQGYELVDPYNTVNVVVMQNNRWDNAIYNLEPRFAKQDELDYDYEYGNLFQGGNEFRQFDCRDLNFTPQFIDSIRYYRGDKREHVYTSKGVNRAYLAYLDKDDINGKRLINKRGFANSSVDADYVWVHFKLPFDEPLSGGDLYLSGALCDWKMTNRNKLRYNPVDKQYEAKLYLKQGYYNYHYVYLKDGKRQADERTVEGSHAQTENEYTVYVYHRGITDVYDRLVGMEVISFNR